MALQKEISARLRKNRFGKEFLVGLLGVFALILMVFFGWLMGALGPITESARFHVLYDFAGGVEVGSPVRVSGVKVGRVENIEFQSEALDTQSSLKITISVSKRAMPTVREDSRFYINMAGIIGERYIEISPGNQDAKVLEPGSVVRGIDPPRVDQLLSQGYGAFGKVQEFFERNETNITSFMTNLEQLLVDANKLLKGSEKRKLIRLTENLIVITDDMKKLTSSLSSEKSETFFEQLNTIIDRVHAVDEKLLRDFLQEEGIRARIF